MAVNELVMADGGKMRSSGPEGAPNMVGEWYPFQVEARGGKLREDVGEPQEVIIRPGKAAGKKLAVVRGAAAKAGIEALMKRYR